MRNVLEMMKEESTAGHGGRFKPCGVRWGILCVQPQETGKQGTSCVSISRWPGWIPQHLAKSASGLCFVLPHLCHDGEISPQREGCVCTALYLTCSCHTKYLQHFSDA